MAARTHYQVLGIRPDASSDAIRDAYRRRAREHHPDRAASSPSAGAGTAMPEVNEAYRVLSDPGRRAMYDASLRGVRPQPTPDREYEPPPPPAHPRAYEPARVPWRSLLFFGAIACIAIIVLAQFIDPPADRGPDGILRVGDCVRIEPNNDAREVSCTGDGDVVVEVLVPFDADCPGRTLAHRDSQGMGIACVVMP